MLAAHYNRPDRKQLLPRKVPFQRTCCKICFDHGAFKSEGKGSIL